jgi:hypothetical protein
LLFWLGLLVLAAFGIVFSLTNYPAFGIADVLLILLVVGTSERRRRQRRRAAERARIRARDEQRDPTSAGLHL